MRYAVAGLISLLIVAGGYGYYIDMERSIKADIKSQFEAEGMAVPPEVAAVLDSEKPAKAAFLGYGTELPGHIVSKITLGDFLRKYAVCLTVFVCGISFGIAYWMSPKPPQQESQR
jgi:hypothetical protein